MHLLQIEVEQYCSHWTGIDSMTGNRPFKRLPLILYRDRIEPEVMTSFMISVTAIHHDMIIMIVIL